MSETLQTELQARLSALVDPHTERAFGEAIRVSVRNNRAAVRVLLNYPAAGWHVDLDALIKQTLMHDGSVEAVTVEIETEPLAHAVQGGLSPLDGVGNVIAVASGKGGVGKSTVAVNLALALQAEGATVGVLDADIYGPSIPRMLGLSGKPETTSNRRILPMRSHGLQAMSIGVLVETDQAMIWRGPMATQALQQMVSETLWDGLDYLIVDLPPGTGDIQLTLAQRIPVAAAVTVTTPQDVAVDDVRRAVAMFAKVRVPVLGVIENMSTHVCSNCGHEEAIFGEKRSRPGTAGRNSVECLPGAVHGSGRAHSDVRTRESKFDSLQRDRSTGRGPSVPAGAKSDNSNAENQDRGMKLSSGSALRAA